MHRVFIDGSEGTTGLEIHGILSQRSDIEILSVDPEKRKDLNARLEQLNRADVGILCLPDDAAREVALALSDHTGPILIDASTAHRIDPDWTYGLPELHASQSEQIRAARRISNPGCHATAFNLLVRPLIESGLADRDVRLVAHSLTGYSGGGKKMIARFSEETGEHLAACPYALGMQHKHLPEMQTQSRLTHPPAFLPVVGRFYRGLIVTIPLCRDQIQGAPAATLVQAYQDYFQGQPCVSVLPLNDLSTAPQGLLDPTACNLTNRADIMVHASGTEHVLLACRIDNLGKGATGAAIQNLNLVLGRDPLTGLRIH